MFPNMSFIHEAPVFQLSYDLLKEIHLARKTFEKGEKYSLGEKLEEASLDLLLAITRAGCEKREWKITTIDSALMGLERVKVLIRLGYDLNQLGERRAIALQESVQKIGRMLGGWRKAS